MLRRSAPSPSPLPTPSRRRSSVNPCHFERLSKLDEADGDGGAEIDSSEARRERADAKLEMKKEYDLRKGRMGINILPSESGGAVIPLGLGE